MGLRSRSGGFRTFSRHGAAAESVRTAGEAARSGSRFTASDSMVAVTRKENDIHEQDLARREGESERGREGETEREQ